MMNMETKSQPPLETIEQCENFRLMLVRLAANRGRIPFEEPSGNMTLQQSVDADDDLNAMWMYEKLWDLSDDKLLAHFATFVAYLTYRKRKENLNQVGPIVSALMTMREFISRKDAAAYRNSPEEPQ